MTLIRSTSYSIVYYIKVFFEPILFSFLYDLFYRCISHSMKRQRFRFTQFFKIYLVYQKNTELDLFSVLISTKVKYITLTFAQRVAFEIVLSFE